MLEIGFGFLLLISLLLFMRKREEGLPEEIQLEEKIAGVSFGDSMLVVASLFIVAFVLFIIQAGG